MRSFIIDPAKKSIEEIELPGTEKGRLKKIVELLDGAQYQITFIYPTEFRTCTGYLSLPKRSAPFFRVRGFVDKVKFGKTVVIDKTATGFPKSDKITLAELEPMITFFT
jgi:hypothetical protein